jgi:hypothetical protein
MEPETDRPDPQSTGSGLPPAETADLGFGVYEQALSDLIGTKEYATPFVMNISGSWGSGKTTLMNAIRSRLDTMAGRPPEGMRYCKTVWFQAWKHDREEPFRSALAEAIFKAMAADGFFGLAKSRIEEIVRRIDRSGTYRLVSRLVAGMDVSEFFAGLDDKSGFVSVDPFQKFFDDLVWTFLNWRFRLSGKEKPDDRRAVLVVFIDGLDHCSPDRIVRMLETIGMFMDRCGLLFVIGADREILRGALGAAYGRGAAAEMFEKLVHIHFSLPQSAAEDFAPLVDPAMGGMSVFKKHLSLLMPALGHSPRRLKRFINQYRLLAGLLHHTGAQVGADTAALWCVINGCLDARGADFRLGPENLFAFQHWIRRLADPATTGPPQVLKEIELEQGGVPVELRAGFGHPDLIPLVDQLELTDETLDVLARLTRSVFQP